MANTESLPKSFTWRGIELKRVIHKEHHGGGIYDFSGGRTIERASDPPVFSGAVGAWRYTVELQANGSWVGKVYFGGASNVVASPYPDWATALDFAVTWWRLVIGELPRVEGDGLR